LPPAASDEDEDNDNDDDDDLPNPQSQKRLATFVGHVNVMWPP